MELIKESEFIELPYRVGPLLYTPGLSTTIASKILNNEIEGLTSIAFCLEDSIQDNCLEKAEKQLKTTLLELSKKTRFELPNIFVRIRTPEHLEKIHEQLGSLEEILTGYIFPKFDLNNSSKYCHLIAEYNKQKSTPLYFMPVLESRLIADIGERVDNLWRIKAQLDTVSELVLNVRVGGNDLSNLYRVRRGSTQTIYEIGVVRDILTNIINVFAVDYVVSGVVWDYFGTDINDSWATGLKKELELDMINGFIGKTAIHPSQLPIIIDGLKVNKTDYDDAISLLNWEHECTAVSKSVAGNRMNEEKCHRKWAERIVILAKVYGIK